MKTLKKMFYWLLIFHHRVERNHAEQDMLIGAIDYSDYANSIDYHSNQIESYKLKLKEL
jgi:hypothetical protein